MWVLCCKNRADYSIEQQRQQDIISIGQFTIVQTLNGRTVQKIPSDKSGIYSTRAVKIEAQVYRHLDRYKRIARCLQGSENYTDLRYEVNGDLGAYLRNHCPSDHVRHRIARQAIEVVIFIHKVLTTPISPLDSFSLISVAVLGYLTLVDHRCRARMLSLWRTRHILCLGMRTLRTLCRVTFCPRINYLRVIGRPQTLRGVGRRRNKRLYSNNTFHSLDKSEMSHGRPWSWNAG